MHLVQTVVEVTGLEVMRHTGDLETRNVVNVGVLVRQRLQSALETGRLAVVQDDDAESVGGIVQVGGGSHRVHDEVILLAAAGDEDVDGRAVVASQSQLRALALLHRPHGPGVVHERGDRGGHFDTNEDPSSGVDGVLSILRPDDAHDAQSEVSQVQERVHDGQERHHGVQMALPALPDLHVVAVVHLLDRVVLAKVLGGIGRRRPGR